LRPANPVKIKYSKELHDFLKINIALKTLQVLGQVLKDSPGSLPAGLKADIAQECYSIGLRTLRAVFLMAEVNLAEFRTAIEDLIKERRALDPEARVPKDANYFLIWLCLGGALGVVHRVSRAVGHTQLERTYQEVLRRFNGLLSAELIDFAIHLEQFHQVSASGLRELMEYRLRDNVFGYQIVQELVYNYFSLFPADRGFRQRIRDIAGIASEDPRFVETRIKKLPATEKIRGRREGKGRRGARRPRGGRRG
jgi:hypothetical protein